MSKLTSVLRAVILAAATAITLPPSGVGAVVATGGVTAVAIAAGSSPAEARRQRVIDHRTDYDPNKKPKCWPNCQ